MAKQDRQKISHRAYFDQEQKLAIAKKSNGACGHCGIKLSPQDMTVDHFIPISQGGTNEPDNLVILCVVCKDGEIKCLYMLTIRPIPLDAFDLRGKTGALGYISDAITIQYYLHPTIKTTTTVPHRAEKGFVELFKQYQAMEFYTNLTRNLITKIVDTFIDESDTEKVFGVTLFTLEIPMDGRISCGLAKFDFSRLEMLDGRGVDVFGGFFCGFVTQWSNKQMHKLGTLIVKEFGHDSEELKLLDQYCTIQDARNLRRYFVGSFRDEYIRAKEAKYGTEWKKIEKEGVRAFLENEALQAFIERKGFNLRTKTTGGGSL